jgi:hypothetical protein
MGVNQFFEKRFSRASRFDVVSGKKVSGGTAFLFFFCGHGLTNGIGSMRLGVPIADFSSPVNAAQRSAIGQGGLQESFRAASSRIGNDSGGRFWAQTHLKHKVGLLRNLQNQSLCVEGGHHA